MNRPLLRSCVSILKENGKVVKREAHGRANKRHEMKTSYKTWFRDKGKTANPCNI